MDSAWVSEAQNPSSILGRAAIKRLSGFLESLFCLLLCVFNKSRFKQCLLDYKSKANESGLQIPTGREFYNNYNY